MSSNNPIINPMPYIRTSWEFPLDMPQLNVTLTRSYIEIANAINNRTIGIFPANRPAVGGEAWFLTSKKQQNLRQVYPFEGPIAAYPFDIPHNIDIFAVDYVTKCSGSILTTSGNWIGAIYGSGNPIPGQITFVVLRNSAPGVLDGVIRLLNSAPTPIVEKGVIVLEWISRTGSSSNN
jgi:hypothetical protein